MRTYMHCLQVAEFVGSPAVEVCWYFPSSREQYRLSGAVAIVAADHADQHMQQAREAAWAAMSDAGEVQVAGACAGSLGGLCRVLFIG